MPSLCKYWHAVIRILWPFFFCEMMVALPPVGIAVVRDVSAQRQHLARRPGYRWEAKQILHFNHSSCYSPHFWQIICCYIVKFCSFENCKMINGSCSVLAGIFNLDIFHYFSNIIPSVWLAADSSGIKLFRFGCKETLSINFNLITTFPLKMLHWSEKNSIFTKSFLEWLELYAV